MAEDLFAKYTCSFKTKDGAESGSGIIVQIGPEELKQLLQEPSCLKKKVGDKLSADKPCYALITAHSNVYADYAAGPDAPDNPVVTHLTGRKIAVGNSDNQFEIPIEVCIRCRAVSCCGKDSIMRLIKERQKNDFTLMPHSGKCHIGFDFLILFLSVDAMNKKKPERYPDPPKLSLALCQQFLTISTLETSMYWRSGGMVKRTKVSIKQPALAQNISVLHDEVESFIAKRSVSYRLRPQISQIGAPIVLCTESGSYVIGINTREGLVTTLHGVFELLKGGIIPFLAVMRHPNARSLLPSQWKGHVLPHVKSFNHQYTWDLLHNLLVSENGVRILKINPGGFTLDITSGLEILAAVFDNLKGSKPSFGYYHLERSDGNECRCVNNLYSAILKEHVKQFSHDKTGEHGTEIVEALFQCFESMLNCESIAREVLRQNIEFLITIATSKSYGSNAVVNKCFKTIILKQYYYKLEEMEHHGRHECYVHIEHNGRHRKRSTSGGKRGEMVAHGGYKYDMLSSRSDHNLLRAVDSSASRGLSAFNSLQEESEQN